MNLKMLPFGFLILLSLSLQSCLASDIVLTVNNSSNSDVFAESGDKIIKNDSLALGGQYYIGGLNRISEYRAKKNINDAYNNFYDEDFVKSIKDSNKYSFIRLKNDIQVFLVSQRSSSFSSITLGVRVGSSMEPKKLPGLATLLSELLFYEWKRPVVGQTTPYDLFISSNSGVFKTKVAPFLTEYYLSVKQEYFSEALIKFGSYLKGFNPKRIYLEPAMETLQSEFESLAGFSSIRLKQILKELSAEGHVNHGFHLGNMRELLEGTDFDEEALLFELIRFYSSYYSSNLMTISIVSDKSIDELESLARTFFDEIPNLNKQLITPFDLSHEITHPYIDLRYKVIQVKSAEESPYFTIIFPIPHQSPLWKYKPANYISFFFTDYSEQSLYSYFKKIGVISGLETMVEINDNGFSNFVIRFNLNSKGEKAIVKILEITLSFLKLIKEVSISETIINQIRKKRQTILEASTDALYPELSRKIVNVFLRTNCSPTEVLYAGVSMNRIDFNHVKEVIDYLKYDNMILILEKKAFKKSASNILLSSQFFSDSKWKTAGKSISSFFRSINTAFRRTKLGVFPKFLREEHLGGEYLLEDIPDKVIGVLQSVNSTLANDILKIQMPGIDPKFPRNFIIYTEDVPKKEFPVSLYYAIKEFKQAKNFTEISLSEASDNSTDFSHLHLSNPINPRDLVIALSTTKMSSISRSFCYLPTSFNPDVMISVKLQVPKNPPKEFSYPEKLAILMFLFQNTLYDVLPSNLNENFFFERNYHLWELQEFFYGLEFSWRGFSSIFPDSLNEIANILSTFGNSIKQASFQNAKKRFQDIIDSFKSENDNLKLLSLSYQLLDPGFMKIGRLENELYKITMQNLIDFVNFFLNSFSISGSIFGNATPVQIKYYLSSFVNTVRKVDNLSELEDQSNAKIINVDEKVDLGGPKFFDVLESEEFGFEVRERMLRSKDKKTTVSKDSKNNNNQSNKPDEVVDTNQYKLINVENLGYTRSSFYDMNRLPYNYSNSYFFFTNSDKDSKNNIVFLQIHYGFYSEQSLAFLQIVSELNSYKYFIEFSENRCTDCSLKILPRIILGKYLVLEFKLQSTSKNIKELGELLNNFFQTYYSRPSKMVSKSEVQKAKEFLLLLARNARLAENNGNLMTPKSNKVYYEGSDSEDLFTLSSFYMGFSKHTHLLCSWKKDYIEFIDTLTFDQFFKYWQYFSNSSRLFISYQSHSTNYELFESLESYLPQGFTRLSFVESLYDINEQQTIYNI
ncbi:secreted insulinase-like peptidase [Cryptosporidium ubiquitum]|uniref:Secreted insulinase-like peptidase n=1 Tax=Cryptosporidium ubiquitum TaxID=857276 RepID=A0A1J4MJH8_9CRYT|nr:secreted insulinase-like peptidase [Cryptosporidium ubiquitum]OII74384.1 secreted insulinase-like peptidase [Cryptosporidium ubiquitum]